MREWILLGGIIALILGFFAVIVMGGMILARCF
jgi:hypothetical protein